MAEDELRIRVVNPTSSETFRKLLEEIRLNHPRFYMVLDNASYHKSRVVRDYVESAGGDAELEFLPPYATAAEPGRDRRLDS